jgi:APA family basic amino acid/polyamine antiporter
MTNLKKEIGLFGGISILAGIMIGSGIFISGSIVLVSVGFSIGLSLLAWLLGGIITLFSGLTYAELGTMFPETGGYYTYLKKAYGKKVAFLSAMMNFVLSSSGSIALLALVFAEILSYIFPMSQLLVRLVAALLIIALSVVNYFGIKVGALVQKIFLVIKLIPIFGIIFIGLFLGTEQVNFSFNMLEGVSIFNIFTMIGFGVIATLWAYEGWTNLNTVTGEMKDVKKDLPKALTISIVFVMITYLLFIFSLYKMIPFAELQNSTDASNFSILAMMNMFGGTGMMVIFIAVLISIFGALNGSVMVFPRVYYAMAKDETFFSSFQKLDKKYQTPYVAIIASGVMAILLLVFNIRELLTFVVFGGLVFNTLIFYSVYIFRKRYKDLERPYKVFGYPYVPAIAIFSMLALLVSSFTQYPVPVNSLIGLGVIVFSYFLYDFIERRTKIKQK